MGSLGVCAYCCWDWSCCDGGVGLGAGLLFIIHTFRALAGDIVLVRAWHLSFHTWELTHGVDTGEKRHF